MALKLIVIVVNHSYWRRIASVYDVTYLVLCATVVAVDKYVIQSSVAAIVFPFKNRLPFLHCDLFMGYTNIMQWRSFCLPFFQQYK